MNETKTRRLFVPILIATSVLATGGTAAWYMKRDAGDANPTVAAVPLTKAVESWAKSEVSQQPGGSGTEAGTYVQDPFLKLTPASVAAGGHAVQPAAYQEPAREASRDRYQDSPVLARGQSPERLSPATEPTTGNPLRNTGFSDAAEDEAARRAFGEVLATEGSSQTQAVAEPAPLPVAPAGTHEVPVAFEDDLIPPTIEPAPFNSEPAEPLPADDGQLMPPAAFSEPAPLQPFAASSELIEVAEPSNQLRESPASDTLVPPAPFSSATNEPAAVAEPAPRRMASVVTERSFQPAPGASGVAHDRPASSVVAPPSVTLDSPPGSDRPGERAMEGRQQPSIAIQKFAPAEVQVGKPCKIITKVRNMGQRPAVGVIVRDNTPAGARLMATTPPAETAGDSIAWSLGTLSPGEERTLEMELTPIDEGEIGSVATVSFAAHATARSRCTRPQLAIRMTAPSRVLVGRQQKVKIELHNPGTGDATSVMLLENVPENLRHEAGPALEFEVGTLRAGETRTLELVMSAEKAGHVTNVLTARADGNLEVQQQVEFQVVAPELAVDVNGPRRRYLERPATYTVSIENPGTATARDVRLVTRLPQGLRFVKANNLGEYDAASHSVYWSLAELPEGEQGEVQLTAMPVTSGELTLQVEGQASEGLKDEAAMAIQIEGIAALKFEVLDVEDPIEVGGETMYEVRVANQGTKAATNVGVRFVTPAGMQAVAASGESRHTVQSGAVVFAPLPRLAPQAEALFRVRVQGIQPGDQRMTVEVTSDDLAQPVRKEESTRVFGDE